MRRFQAERSLKTLLWNATELMRRRAQKEGLVDKVLVYPVELDSIYVCGSYLKGSDDPKDLDVIALYRHKNKEERDLIAKFGRAETYRTAINKLRKDTENVDLQLYDVETYDFTVNPYVPSELRIPIDRVKKVWEICDI